MTGKVEDRPLRESATLVFLAAIAMVRHSPCSVAIRRAQESSGRPLTGCVGRCTPPSGWLLRSMYITVASTPLRGCGGTSIEERAL